MGIAKSGRALGKNEKFLLGTVMILSVAFIYWTFLLDPALKKIKPLEDNVKALKLQVKNAANTQSNINAKEKQLEGLKGQYEEATKIVSKTDRYPQLIKEIREIASANSLKITNETLGVPTIYAPAQTTPVEPGKEAIANPADGLKTMSLVITLDGGFNNVLAFVNKLEEDKRILEVQSFAATDKSTTVNLMYYIAGGEEAEDYDFNTGSYGKDNLFN
ncbi:MAG: type 4a pilus biogenesis protein PilO [Clostridium sp.]